MARPQKAPNERRVQQTKVRYTPDEFEHVRSQAQIAGLSHTDFIREVSLGAKLHAASSSVKAAKADAAALLLSLNALTIQTRRIGNNVNQLATATHRGSDFVQFWEEIGAELHAHLSLLEATMNNVGKIYDSSNS